MKELQPLFLLAGAFLAYRYLTDKSTSNRSLASVRMQIEKVDFSGKTLVVHFNIQNANSKATTIKSVIGDLYLNNQMVGRVSKFETKVIEPNAETKLSVNVVLKPLFALSAFVQLTKQIANSTIVFDGVVNVDDRPQSIKAKFSL